MRKQVLTMALAVFCLALSAQDGRKFSKFGVTPFGSLQTYAAFDTRQSAGGTGLTYFLPYDVETNRVGSDIYSSPSMSVYGIATKQGFTVSGYRFGNMSVSGKVDTDFYLMNGKSASLRLREAYADLSWGCKGRRGNSITLRIGEAWNPMTYGTPYTLTLEQGAPFNPYAHSPQAMFSMNVRNWTCSAGVLYPMEYCPTGPSGASSDYVKYGIIPEVYAGVAYAKGPFSARLGLDFLSIKPRWRTTTTDDSTYDVGTKVSDRAYLASAMLFAQYERSSFGVNAKTVLAAGGDHLSLLGGYALSDDSDILNYKYTPLITSTSYVSVFFKRGLRKGRVLDVRSLFGYMKALGTLDDLAVDENGYASSSDIYYSENGAANVNQVIRVNPAVVYELGSVGFGLEYNFTYVQYGSLDSLFSEGLCTSGLQWVLNHRIAALFRFCF